MDIQAAISKKYGPLAAWQWGLAAGAAAYLALRYKKGSAPKADTGSLVRDPVTGEFKSQQSQTTVDPKTGEERTSSYEASGPLGGGWGGGVGLPMAYPMPYSQGDVYVNLPGDHQQLAGGRPARYPPKVGPGVSAGHAGGYWWSPLNREDVAWLGATAYGMKPPASADAQQAVRIAMNYTRLVDANPQFDWAAIRDVNDLIGKPIYVPGGDSGDPKRTGYLPPGATVNAPSGYVPPTQQTSVSGTA